MPRFFFHFHDGGSRLEDEEGSVLPDAEAAWYQAVRSARDIISHDLSCGSWRPGRSVEIEDEQGLAVWAFRFEEVAGVAT
jgi:hypothetical protein